MNIQNLQSYSSIPARTEVNNSVVPKQAEEAQPKATSDQVSLGENTQQMPDAIKPHKKWLFMNYIAADCNLTDFQLANIDQQEKVGSDENTHVVAYVDVGDQKNCMGDWHDCRTYYVTKDDQEGKLNSEVIQEFGKTDMSDYKTLTKFVVDAMGKFPADHVCLVLNDHGGGFTGAMSDDGSGKGSMSVPDMKKALAEAEAITGKKIDVLGFDACLMAETEVAYELKDHANIFMASEETENGPGWAYESMLNGANMSKVIERVQESSTGRINVDPEAFAKIVIDINNEHIDDIPTFSITDMSKMEGFKDSLNGLAETIMKSDDKESVKQAIRSAENYGQGWAPYGDIRDVGNLADNIIASSKDESLVEAAKNVKASLAEAVMYNSVGNQHPKSQGLSIYAPTNKPQDLGFSYEDLQFTKDTKWDEMLKELGVGSKQEPVPAKAEFWPDGQRR